MNAPRFIASKLRFKGKIAVISVAVSFFIMIIAVAISSGFRQEIRNGVSTISGDIQLTPSTLNYVGEEDPVNANPAYLSALDSLPGVKELTPVVYRAGIVKAGDLIQGVLFKGIPDRGDTVSLGVSIPSRLSEILGLKVGDKMLTYFVGERIKVRKFEVTDIYPSIIESDESLLVRADLGDLQRLNGWDGSEVSALEVTLEDAYKSPAQIEQMSGEVGTLAMLRSTDVDDPTVATSVIRKYPALFSWLDLIDFNVLLILTLMTVVAGFNMISSLLILLFRHVSTIGTLKSMGMTDRDISSVFLRVSSTLVLKGMLIGNAAALLFCLIQGTTHWIKLDPANYFVSFVPVAVNLPMILLADAIAYGVIMLLLLIPCLFIAKVDPARTVRAQ
jgi:lipoprotein-releasing system permease protein